MRPTRGLDRGEDDDPASPRDRVRRRRADHDLLREGFARPARARRRRRARHAGAAATRERTDRSCPAGRRTTPACGSLLASERRGERIVAACLEQKRSTRGLLRLAGVREPESQAPEQARRWCSTRRKRVQQLRTLDDQQNGENAPSPPRAMIFCSPLLGGGQRWRAASPPGCSRLAASEPRSTAATAGRGRRRCRRDAAAVTGRLNANAVTVSVAWIRPLPAPPHPRRGTGSSRSRRAVPTLAPCRRPGHRPACGAGAGTRESRSSAPRSRCSSGRRRRRRPRRRAAA